MPDQQPDYRPIVAQAASDAGVDPALVDRVVQAESGYNPYAVSPKGAMGLMQLMPSTAVEFGAKNPMDPEQNVRAGVKKLKGLLDRYNGDERLALAAYNAGEGAVDQHGGVPPYKETQAYVNKIAGPVDYDMLAAKVEAPKGGTIDYDALAKQAEGTDKGQVVYSNRPQAGSSGSLAAAVASKAVPVTQAALEEFGTNPAIPKMGSQIGRVIGGITAPVAGAIEGGPVGGLVGLAAASRGAWAGGKTGWFTAKLAQDIARPISRLVDAAGPYASMAFKASAIQSALDLAQTAEPNRKDIGVLGMAIGDKTDPQHPALINAIWDHLVSVVHGDNK